MRGQGEYIFVVPNSTSEQKSQAYGKGLNLKNEIRRI